LKIRILFSIIIAVIFAMAINGCRRELKNEGIVLARVENTYLYEDNIKGLIPRDTGTHDSIQMVKDYIRKWIQTQLMVEQAKKNLPEEKLDFEKQLEDYRNSLIIYQYETELVKQKLDTVISHYEIGQYYQSHLNDFELKENIVKVAYAILSNSDEGEYEAKLLTRIFHLSDSLLLDSLDYFGYNFGINYSTDTNNWIRFNDLLKKVPLETYNQALYLKNHRFVNLKDDRYIYLLKFINFKIKDETSPLGFEVEYIKSIILNKRKTVLLKKLRKDIMDEAVEKKSFEIY